VDNLFRIGVNRRSSAVSMVVSLGRQLGRGFADLVYPPRCLVCDFPGPEALCLRCLAAVRAGGTIDPGGAPGLEVLAAAGRYQGVLRDAIHGLKYGRRRGLAPPLGELLARRAEEEMPRWRPDLILPVPIHWRRRFHRGFNQAELLVDELARLMELPVDRVSLARVRHTRSQVGLSGDMRRQNLEGAFRVRRPEAIRGRSLLLVDDVCTTKTTLIECARVLRAAGAHSIYALVLSA
jgi:ComF family protein